MPEYLEDPSSLTKDKLKSELLANNVELPGGNPTKDVYVQLYLKNLTAQNKKLAMDTAATWDAFSSDEELPPPVISNRSRSSGRKATRKTDKVQLDEVDVTVLTDEGLRDELLKHGVDVGPVVASTRKLYEKKLQKLLDNGPTPVLPPQQVNHNGHSESDLYSDKEDEVTAEPEPVAEVIPEPEPIPVVERPLRSRGKTPVTTRTRSSQHQTIIPEDLRPVLRDPVQLESNWKVHHKPEGPARADPRSTLSRHVESQPEEHRPPAAASTSSPLVHLTRVNQFSFSPRSNMSASRRQESTWTMSQSPSKASSVTAAGVEKITASEQNTKVVEKKEVLKELFPNDLNSPTGISATCRRPIRGAAGRPLMPSDLWNNENSLFSPKITKTSSSSCYTESRTVNRVSSLPPSLASNTTSSSSSSSSSSGRLLSAAPPAVQTKVARRGMSLWIKLFLLAIVAAFLFLVYQAMETNGIGPFITSDKEVVSGSTA
ncbi:thymopoietin a isoform X2 [Solea solea]|uniref:thymopoietin a isoform X2 n=1 Tax=Solea solea TaxID=90069 RepID=UPI00272A5286|nr:thymopoietin a isoform X2 [Solea solea]